jgi:hypothetical protein
MSKKRLQKKKKREVRVKKKVAQRREEIREGKRIEKEIEKIRWDARERITPIRNPKND